MNESAFKNGLRAALV